VVLGRYPAYVEKAAELGAEFFEVPFWNQLSSSEAGWGINRAFLDQWMAAGAEFELATPTEIGTGSFFEREVQYLLSNGYRFASATRLVP